MTQFLFKLVVWWASRFLEEAGLVLALAAVQGEDMGRHHLAVDLDDVVRVAGDPGALESWGGHQEGEFGLSIMLFKWRSVSLHYWWKKKKEEEEIWGGKLTDFTFGKICITSEQKT